MVPRAEALPKALAIDPDDVRARYKLGVAYARRGDAVRADECFAAIVEKGDDGAQAAARERVKLREQAAPTFEHGFLGRGAFSEDRASPDDEGLRRKLAARLCVDADGPALGRDAVVELQRRTLELYRSEAFRDVPKGDVAALDAFKADACWR